MPTCGLCIFEQNFQADCNNRPGGGHRREVYVLNYCDLETGTEDDFVRAYGSNVITSISLKVGACFNSIGTIRDTAQATTEPTANGAVTQTLVFNIATRASASDKYESAQLAADLVDQLNKADGEFVVVVTEKDGVAKVYGLQSGLNASATFDSGVAPTDVPAFTVTFSGVDSKQGATLDTTSYSIPVCP